MMQSTNLALCRAASDNCAFMTCRRVETKAGRASKCEASNVQGKTHSQESAKIVERGYPRKGPGFPYAKGDPSGCLDSVFPGTLIIALPRRLLCLMMPEKTIVHAVAISIDGVSLAQYGSAACSLLMIASARLSSWCRSA
jgi:hypothetical protein